MVSVPKSVTWTLLSDSGADIRYYACTGCRAIREKDGEGQIPIMKADMQSKRWVSGTDAQHVCGALNRNQVTGTTLRRKAQQELTQGEKDSVPQATRHLETSIMRDFVNIPEGMNTLCGL